MSGMREWERGPGEGRVVGGMIRVLEVPLRISTFILNEIARRF